jgi:hypothetical protein
MTTRWIPVMKVTDGLFPSEKTVYINTVDGEVSVFVASARVNEAENRLNVVVLDEDATHSLIQVPSQGGTTIAKVPR